jgi:hypothetical protein
VCTVELSPEGTLVAVVSDKTALMRTVARENREVTAGIWQQAERYQGPTSGLRINVNDS